MTFLEAVNLILRINTFIAGDDDDISSFSDTQHRASLNLAKISVKSSLNELIADRLIPYEETDGNLTLVSGQRIYSLPSDFVRFVGSAPFFLKLEGAIGSDSDNQFVYEYPGGEDNLRWHVLDYRSQSGTPQWFYIANGTSKQIGLYPVPDSGGNVYRFPYQKDVTVTNESDSLPFHTEQEAQAFVDMAARYMKYLIEKLPASQLAQDPVFRTSKSALMALMKPIKSKESYGYRYGGD